MAGLPIKVSGVGECSIKLNSLQNRIFIATFLANSHSTGSTCNFFSTLNKQMNGPFTNMSIKKDLNLFKAFTVFIR